VRFVSLVVPLIVGVACHGRLDGGVSEPPRLFDRQGNAVSIPDGSPLRSKLTLAAVVSKPVRRSLSAPAHVEAEPSRMARIAPPLPGRVVKLLVHFGDRVDAGTPLFLLDSADLVAAQSDYLKAKSAHARATRSLARQKDLIAHGIGAQRDLEQAQTEQETAKSELERTATRLKLLGMSPGNVGGPLSVPAPLAGRVIELSTAPGQYQNDPAAILMIIADLSTVWVTANVQEKDIRRVKQGDEAVTTFAAYPGEVFPGTVLAVGDLLDPETRSIKVRVALKNDELRLKPGMFANVAFRGAAAAELVVPSTAVVLDGDKSAIWVQVGPWRFEKRIVEVSEQVGSEIVVTKGLESGATVVTTNAVLLP